MSKNILKDVVYGGHYDRDEKVIGASLWSEQANREGTVFRNVNEYVQTVTLQFEEPAVTDTTIQIYSASGDNMETRTHLADTTVYPGGTGCQIEIHKYVDNIVAYQTSPYSGNVADITPVKIAEAITNANYMNPLTYARISTKDYLLQNGMAPLKKIMVTFVLIMFTLFLMKRELPKKYDKRIVVAGTVLIDLMMAGWFVSRAMRQAAYPSYRNAILLMGMISVMAVTLVVYLLIIRRWELYRVYAIAGFLMGLVFMILLPVYQVPDETVHLNAAYEVSNWMMGEKLAEDGTIYMRPQDQQMEVQTGQFTPESYERYYSSIFEKANHDQVIKTNHEAAQTWHYQYVVSSLGITIGRLLGMGPGFTFLLGRLFSLIAFVAMTTYAIKKTPVGKMILFVLALLPMTVQQSMSYSYDAILIPTVFLTVALSLHLAYGDYSDISIGEYVVLTLSGIACTMAKGHAYFATAFLPLVVLLNRKNKQKREIRNVVIIALICLASFVVTYKIQGIIFPYTDTVPEGYQNYIAWADSEGYTIAGLLSHPAQLLKIIYHTITGYTPYYLETFLGNRLGWLELYLSDTCLQIIFFGLVLASVPRKDNPTQVSLGTSLALWGTGILEIMLIFAGFLISWTPITETAICGVQGRYFIPVAVLILMAFRGKFAKVSSRLDAPLCVTSVVMLCWVVTSVISKV